MFMFFLALLTLAKALLFSRRSLRTVAMAASSLALRASGEEDIAYWWSGAFLFRLLCLSLVDGCGFEKKNKKTNK